MELTTLSVIAGAGATCALGGVLPWISAEAVLLGAALAVPTPLVPALVVGCALGQVVGKVVLYGLMRWAPERVPARFRPALDRAGRYAHRPRILTGAVLSGSVAGLPPFYLVTLASGLARLPLVLFAGAGLLGSLIRYGAVVWGAGQLGWGGGS